jgi:hypothetical protein
LQKSAGGFRFVEAARRQKALWIVQRRTVHVVRRKRSARGVRRESVFVERRSKRPAHQASPDDRKRVEAP